MLFKICFFEGTVTEIEVNPMNGEDEVWDPISGAATVAVEKFRSVFQIFCFDFFLLFCFS